MSGVSSDRIAALVEAAKKGQLPDGGDSPAAPRHRHRLRLVDFTRPTKFTTDHQRRITRAVEAFCQQASTRLSAEMRTQIDLEMINSLQVTWAAAQMDLPPGVMSMTLDIQPLGTQMLLATEMPFLLMALEILLGGNPDKPPPERRLSEIDWALMRRTMESMVANLALPFRDMADLELIPGHLDQGTDVGRAIALSEPTFVVEIEIRIGRHSSATSLLIPWIAIEPVADRVAGKEEEDLLDKAENQKLIARSMATVPVTVRAEVAATHMAVAEILSLKPGSVITFGVPADRGVEIFAENVPIGRGRPGAHGARRAFQMEAPGV